VLSVFPGHWAILMALAGGFFELPIADSKVKGHRKSKTLFSFSFYFPKRIADIQ
jgi:hypothetical protein